MQLELGKAVDCNKVKRERQMQHYNKETKGVQRVRVVKLIKQIVLDSIPVNKVCKVSWSKVPRKSSIQDQTRFLQKQQICMNKEASQL